MALYQQKNDKLVQLQSHTASREKNIQKLVEANLDVIFEMHFIASEYEIAKGRRIDTFAVDKDGRPVIIEYKKRSDENVINQAISYLKWLQDQKQEFFEKIVETRVKHLPKDFKVRWGAPRLICIAENFGRYDLDAVEMISNIKLELYTYIFFKPDLFQLTLLNRAEKEPLGKPAKEPGVIGSPSIKKLLEKCSDEVKELFNALQSEIFMLDVNVEENVTNLYVSYRLAKNFVELHFIKNEIKVYLRPKQYNDPAKLIEVIPEGYNWTMNRRVRLKKEDDLDAVMKLIKQSFQDVL